MGSAHIRRKVSDCLCTNALGLVDMHVDFDLAL